MHLPSGLRSCIDLCAHRAGTGGSKIRPFWNCADANPHKATVNKDMIIFMVIIPLQ